MDTDTVFALRDSLRDLADLAVERDGMTYEVMAVMKAYHALAGAFGYPADLDE